MVIATATASASSAFHHTAPCSHAAAPVPATTGATWLGSLRGRWPSIHCQKLPPTQIVACCINGHMLGVIGGSDFYTFFDDDARTVEPQTPYGPSSAPITIGTVGDRDVAFLPR